MTQHLVSSALGIVDTGEISETLQKARQGQEIPTVTLMRTLGIELWLRNLKTKNILRDATWPTERTGEATFQATE